MTLPHAWLAVGDHGHLGRVLGVVVGSLTRLSDRAEIAMLDGKPLAWKPSSSKMIKLDGGFYCAICELAK